MPRTAVLMFLFLTPTVVNAQLRKCRIVAGNSGEAISNVAISGLQSKGVWLTDSLGLVQIPAAETGPFRISHISFQTRILRPDTTSVFWTITLQPVPYSLEGVTVLSPMARFRRDSAFNHSFFRRELADAKMKTGKKLVFIRSFRGVELGIEFDGLISNLALVASGKKAHYRGFARNIKRYEADRLATIRYTTTLVSEQTGLEEDSAYAFIASHPLDDDFLRSATELELKMRVREMYRQHR